MPPFLPRKRLRSESPKAGPSKTAHRASGEGKSTSTTPRKPTLFDDLDAGVTSTRTAEHGRALLEKLAAVDEESSLSSLSDDEFEDVPTAKRQKTSTMSENEEDEDEDIEFEDVVTNAPPRPVGPAPSGDLELTLRKDTRVSLTNPLGTKKGPSKIERGIRVATHQMHVQMLMWHNAVRNSWLCDASVQEILVEQLPRNIVKEVENWRRRCGLLTVQEEGLKGRGKDATSKVKGKSNGKGKEKGKGKKPDPRRRSDWGELAERAAPPGEVDMSHGDPLNRLLDKLGEHWREQFRVTAPGLRKLGYMSLERLDAEMKSFNNDAHDPELHGERFRNIKEFKHAARTLEGSRDVGAQLFTSLLRGLGLEARMVANLQPVGFGWSSNEEAAEKNPRKLKAKKEVEVSDEDSSAIEESEGEQPIEKSIKKGKSKYKAPAKHKTPAKPNNKHAKREPRNIGARNVLIALSESDEVAAASENDDDSVIDVTPARKRPGLSLPYDKDLLFPHYWTEVLSPVTNTYTAIDANVIHIIATSPELLEKFEPRGGKADKSKQVTTYIVGYSPDGTAKDVTTRYLKRHVWPGRTKGNRLPTEKVPVYNRHGKVKHYEDYDWFKTVISGYARGSRKCPRTEIDDHEEATDLKPVKLAKKEVEEGKETFQSYKSSTEFVLERHFKREEALRPGAKHVKMFTVKGKGDETTEEKVFLRKDVVNCKSMETWHKEGRAPIDGETPLKRVPYRAATTNRRRELAEAEHASGEKVLQGLFSRDQTDWIIPPPIQNGIIPKNGYGNIDLYVDSMLPQGAVHIPRRGTVKICKRLGIDYAEAVTGFEFGHRMAVPIISGVVVAEENLEAMMEEWDKDEAERVRKEDEKRTKTAIGMWRKMLMGMRIIKRVREEYGAEIDNHPDALNPWVNRNKVKDAHKGTEDQARVMAQKDEDMAGGFLLEGHNEEEPDHHHSSSFFPVVHEDDDDLAGGFELENPDEKPAKPTIGQAYATPQSLQSTKVRQVSDEDETMQDMDSESAVPQPKKRGRPPGSSNKITKPTSKPKTPATRKTPAKRVAQRITPSSRRAGKRKLVVDSEQDEDESSPSELESESESEVEEPPKKGWRAVAKAGQRKTPRRNAARNSGSALRSRYFDHSDEEEDDA